MRSLLKQFRVILAGLLAFALLHCGGGAEGVSSSTSGSTDGGSTTDDVVGGNIAELTSSSGGSLRVDLSDVAESDDVMFVLYSYDESSSVAGYELGGSVSETPPARTAAVEPNDAEFRFLAENEGDDVTAEFHEYLREIENSIPADASVARRSSGQARIAALNVGSQKTFRVLNSFSSSTSYQAVTATLRYQNEYFQFYVDDRDSDSLDDEDLEQLATDFTEVIPHEREMFGTESDINDDGKFAVLFTREVNGLGGSAGGVVTGFFYAIDLFDRSEYSLSNEMEVFYTFVPDPSGDHGTAVSKEFALSNILRGVLPHEYQHMISFNQHYFLNGGSAEVAWLNEGLAHLAEDIYNTDGSGFMVRSGEENPARVASYLSSISSICFTCGSALNQRGGSYLFLRYLYEQAEFGNLGVVTSGASLINRLLNTSLRSIDNVTYAAFGATGSEEDFKGIVGKFALTVYLSNTGESPNDTLYFDGINLRSIQNDNRGTDLNGPSIQTLSQFPYVDTLSGVSVGFVQASGSNIQELGGEVNLSMDTDAKLGGYVIR